MHEAFRRRLEVLEEARKLQDGEPFVISIGFINADKTPVEATVARTVDRSFECFRREGESAADFKARANSEARATGPRGPMVLIFPKEELPHAT